MRYLTLATVFFLSACAPTEEDLFFVCPESCYSGPDGTKNVGVCHSGTPICEETEVVECEGEVLPSPEVCDGQDNDCDGDEDEALIEGRFSANNTCPQCGKCVDTYTICRDGKWECWWRDGPPAQDDATCDGVDDDCDCYFDEDFLEEGELRFCYTADNPITASLGECRPGLEACHDGHVVCEGEVTPTLETCDGTDQDCNGFVDDVTTTYRGIDLIFGLDISGSMEDEKDAVRTVICDYAEATEGRADLDTRMGLVAIGYPSDGLSLQVDLSDAATLCDFLYSSDFETLGAYAGNEPTISTALAVSDPENPLGISWTVGAKRIFIGFGDEPAQAICEDDNVKTCTENWNFEQPVGCYCAGLIEETAAMCSVSGLDVYWFVRNTVVYEDQAEGCAGDAFWLIPDEEYMLADLNTIISEICLEEGTEP
jgi:hypothetical protein